MSEEPPSTSDEFVDVRGQRLRVSQQGSGGGRNAPALLLLMGLGGALELWQPLRDALHARLPLTTIAVDVPGVGASSTPWLPLRLQTHRRIMLDLLDARGHETVDVVGMSWGGLLAQELALAAPTRVRRLILANTNVGLGSVPGLPLRRMCPRADAEAFHRRWAAAGPTASWRGWSYQALAPLGWTSLPRLHRIRHLTLVIAGDGDRLVPLVNARTLAHLIPSAALHVVKDAGHLLLVKHPERVIDPIVELLDRGPAWRPEERGEVGDGRRATQPLRVAGRWTSSRGTPQDPLARPLAPIPTGGSRPSGRTDP